MSRWPAPVRTLLDLRWLPGALVVVLTAALLVKAAEVSVRDVLAFGVYLLGWIVLPGTAVWRLVDPRQRGARRPLAEDLAIGALLGYVLEFPAYLVCLAAGVPRFYLLWPVVLLGACWALRRRSLFHLGEPAGSRSWSWTSAGLMTLMVLWFTQNSWGVTPSTATALRNPYVDEPFHLSLAVGLRHVFPPQYPYVADTPLEYHWLSHLHVAAASWVTGTEPAILLRSLTLQILFLVVAFATARVAVRLTGASWTQPATLAAFLVVPASFSGWEADRLEGLLSTRLMASPSAGFVNAALLLGILLVLEMLVSRTTTWPLLVVTALTLVAMGGAKSTSLPTVMAGLAGATLVCSVAERRLHRLGAVLTLLSVAAFVVVQEVFFGGGSHGLDVRPLERMTSQGLLYPSLLYGDGHMQLTVKVLILVGYVAYLSLAAALLALLLRGGWRRPDHLFLVITCAAGFGASVVFHQSSYSEYYFLYVVLLPLVLGAVLGLRHVLEPLPPAFGRQLCLTGFALGSLVAVVMAWVTTEADPDRISGTRVWQAVTLYAVPALVVLVLVAALAPLTTAITALRTRRPDLSRAGLLPAALLVLAGLGGVATARLVRDVVTDPIPPAATMPARPTIAPGGIEAARWIRDHTALDEVIATNAHCIQPGTRPPCDVRNFWMAAYSERTMLVEGWAYISWSTVGKEAPEGQSTIVGPFWDPNRLAANDAALQDPSRSTTNRLREDYGVRWLLLDGRYPYDRRGLEPFTEVAFAAGRYRVLRLR